MMAARAGARYVVACEAKKPIADVASYIVQHNGSAVVRDSQSRIVLTAALQVSSTSKSCPSTRPT
jgi:hypothetical protein